MSSMQDAPPKPMTIGDPRVPESIWARVLPGSLGCWNWTGTEQRGYGICYIKPGCRVPVHRFVMEAYLGAPIDPVLHVDHLCRNHGCCNPDHLEVVTRQENILRGIGPTALNARKTHCPQGHPYDDENTLHHGKGRYCRACRKGRVSEQRECPNCGRVMLRSNLARHRRTHLRALLDDPALAGRATGGEG